MHKLYKLKNILIDELEDYADDYSDGRHVTAEDAENIKRLSASVDHLCNIGDHAEHEMSYDDGMDGTGRRYSREYRGERGRSYRGTSNASGRMNATRDSRGRYSGADGDMESVKEDMRRLAEKVEQM